MTVGRLKLKERGNEDNDANSGDTSGKFTGVTLLEVGGDRVGMCLDCDAGGVGSDDLFKLLALVLVENAINESIKSIRGILSEILARSSRARKSDGSL